MAESKCNDCPLRAKFDNNPRSFAGRFWRWHINFCPGWKKYFIGLSPEERTKIAGQYNFKKYQ